MQPFFLHDGSAKTVAEAIERHQGEAAQAQAAYQRLAPQDREALLKFVQSL